jgi:hypothetical protein
MIELKTIKKFNYKGFNVYLQTYEKEETNFYQIKIFDEDGDSTTVEHDYVSKNGLDSLAKEYINKFLLED